MVHDATLCLLLSIDTQVCLIFHFSCVQDEIPLYNVCYSVLGWTFSFGLEVFIYDIWVFSPFSPAAHGFPCYLDKSTSPITIEKPFNNPAPRFRVGHSRDQARPATGPTPRILHAKPTRNQRVGVAQTSRDAGASRRNGHLSTHKQRVQPRHHPNSSQPIAWRDWRCFAPKGAAKLMSFAHSFDSLVDLECLPVGTTGFAIHPAPRRIWDRLIWVICTIKGYSYRVCHLMIARLVRR